MAVIFDGREFANKISTDLITDITDLETKLGRKLKLVTIYNPDNEASRVYTEIKERKARELGIEFEKFSILNLKFSINELISKLNNDKTIDGIMIQMPLGTENDKFLIDLIDLKKDVDGLRLESGVMPATVRAVIAILGESLKLSIFNFQFSINDLITKLSNFKIIIIGNKGMVGARLQEELGCEGMDKEDFDPSKMLGADVIISATGETSLINGQMVKNGVVAIDVGYPKGDFDPDVEEKASFFTPVPGGVGPVTVAMLFRNLVDLMDKKFHV